MIIVRSDHKNSFLVSGSWFLVSVLGIGESMATLRRFEDLEAWQRARELTRDIYRCSKSGAFARDFGLKDQIRRAAVSVMSNIAEGFERGGTAEFAQFSGLQRLRRRG